MLESRLPLADRWSRNCPSRRTANYLGHLGRRHPPGTSFPQGNNVSISDAIVTTTTHAMAKRGGRSYPN